ncbi:MAG: radical SAM protein [Acidobacteriota bacterium]|nr:radical SAM protein [Acidobacteriota bacterium]
MNLYSVQEIYRKIKSPSLRLAVVKTVRAVRKRYLLLRVDTNDACNLRCVMCYFSDPDRKPVARPMTTEMFAGMAKQMLPRTRYLYLSCGAEPFVTAHFDKILDIAGDYNVPFISYCTNGLLMKDKFIEATLRNKVNEVIFSCDGGTKETYERIRVGATWEKLNERLQAFTDAKKSHTGPIPVTRFNFTVQEDNCHDLKAFMDWVSRWEPTTVQLRLFRTLPGAVKQHDDARTLDKFMEALPELRTMADNAGIRLITMDTPDERSERVGAALSPFANTGEAVDPAEGSIKPINCQLPWFNLYLTPDGSVRPCTVHEPVGNFLKQTYEEIENGEPMQRLRHSLRKCPDDICINCQLTGASGV